MKHDLFTPLRKTFSLMVAIFAITGLCTSGTAAEENKWTWTGWGGGGYFWACAADPSNDDVFYLGGDVSGMYKSTDRCKSWKFINKGISNYGVFSMAVAPSNPQTLYILTLNGICKSTNGGESWQSLAETMNKRLKISAKRPQTVRALAVDPRSADVVYAGSLKGEVFKTEDGGKTWQKSLALYNAGSNMTPELLKIKSGDLEILGDFERGNSVDGWKADTKYAAKLADGTNNTTKVSCSGKKSLAVNFNAPEKSWKGSGAVKRYFGSKDLSKYKKLTARIYLPKNAPKMQAQLVVQTGDKWKWQAGPYIDIKPGKWFELKQDLTNVSDLDNTRICYVIIRSPFAPYKGKVYIDTIAAHTSLDDTINPKNLKRKTGLLVVSSVSISASNPDVVYISATGMPLYKSSDAGKTWQELDTPVSAYCVTVSPSDNNIVYASFYKDGVMKSTDAGKTWTRCNNGIEKGKKIRDLAVDKNDPQKVWGIGNGNWMGTVYRSADGGTSWQGASTYKHDMKANPTLPGEKEEEQAKTSSLTNITLSGKDSQNIFVSGNWANIFSADGGKSWSESCQGADISCIQDIKFLNGKTYVTVMDEGLLSSDDNGKNWKQIFPMKYDPKTSGHQWRVIATEKDGKTRLVSTLSNWNNGPAQILVSEDDGKNTRVVKKGLPTYLPCKNCMWGRSYPRALAVDPTNPDTLYLGLDGAPEPEKGRSGGGLFKSTDGGYSWTQLPNQPGSRRMFYGLAVDPTNPKRLYWGACAKNGGVYVSEDGGNSWTHCLKKDAWIFNVVVTPKGTVYACGDKLWVSHDHGKTWTSLKSAEGSFVALAFDPENENRIWTSNHTWSDDANGDIWRSDDGGKTWTSILGDTAYLKPLILRYNPQTKELWAGGVGLFKMKQ